MEFDWTDEQRALHEQAARLAKDALNDGLDERDRAGIFSADGWRRCAEVGVQGWPMPPQYGGRGLGMPSVVAALEGLGRGCLDNGLLFSLGAQLWSVEMPLLLFGSEAQKEHYLPGLISGRSIGAHAVTEPEAGSDVAAMQTTAVRDADDYRLSGKKRYITSAPIADVYLVLATLDRAQGARGITAFLVERSAPGFSASERIDKMGLRTAMMGELTLDNCRVPLSQLLGTEGGGMAVFSAAMEWERAFILTPALGSMQRQIDECIAYARTRRQFGQPIGRNESVAAKIVDMQVRLDTARLLVYQIAWLKQAGKRLRREPSEVKLHVSESWVQNCLDAQQVYGAAGYMTGTSVERDLRDALASRIYSGTSAIQRRLIAGYLGI